MKAGTGAHTSLQHLAAYGYGYDPRVRVLALEWIWVGKAALKLIFERRRRECL